MEYYLCLVHKTKESVTAGIECENSMYFFIKGNPCNVVRNSTQGRGKGGKKKNILKRNFFSWPSSTEFDTNKYTFEKLGPDL